MLAAYAKRLVRVGENARLEVPEAAESGDHRRGSANAPSRPGVRGKFATATVPHDDNRGKDAERYLKELDGEMIDGITAGATPIAAAVERT